VYHIVDKKTVILAMITFITYITYTLSLYIWCRGYYTYEDMFGPLSKNVIIAISIDLFLLMSFLLLYFLSSKCDDCRKDFILSIIVIVLLITSLRILPDVADSYYDQNFYDARGHMTRGAFVTLTGHSDPSIDSYFDLQPAFFWFTAIFINIIHGAPSSPSDPVFGFFIKWFHVIAVLIYIPILFEFLKRSSLRFREAFLALFLFFTLNFTRFHYAAQTYANALFWLSLTLLFDIVMYREAKKIFMLMLIFTAVIFIHEGVTVFMITTLISIIIALLLSKYTKRSLFTALVLFTFFFVSWFIYLLYISNFTLSTFTSLVIFVIKRYLSEGVSGVVSQGVYRPWRPWENVVRFKAIYMGTLILSGTLLTVWMYKATRNNIYLFKIFVILGVSTLIGAVAIGLGGAAYIERVPGLLLPLFSVAFVEAFKQFNNQKYVNTFRKGFIALMFFFIVSAPFVYFSGRNFQSSTYAEHYAYFYSATYSPKDSYGIYTNLNILTLNTAIMLKLSNKSIGEMYVSVPRSAIINTLYYTYGDITKITMYVNELILEKNIVFMNSDYMLLT
jgi:hypothetical protein